MTLWEYRVTPVDSSLESREDVLARFGDKGWELVAVTPDGTAYLKRPRKDGGKP